MKNTKFTLALAISAITLTACGGGGGGSDDTQASTDDTVTPVTQSGTNAKAKELIRATEKLSATNTVVAIIDDGINGAHTEFDFDNTVIDSRSNAIYQSVVQEPSLGFELEFLGGDDYDVDIDPARSMDYDHGTAIASIIFGKNLGLTTGGRALIFDAAAVDNKDGTYNFTSAFPSVNAGYLAITDAANKGALDFASISVDQAAVHRKPGLNGSLVGDAQKNVITDAVNSGTGIVVAAGNKSLDLTEIYVNDTPECTQEEFDAATGAALDRCWALAT